MSIKFFKVPYEQFKKDCIDCGIKFESEQEFQNWYDAIKLPKRSTVGSAGYDFYSPFHINMKTKLVWVKDGIATTENEHPSYIIPTGIRCAMPDNVVLMLYPRSGLGFKYGARLNNTVAIIDADYYNAENYGHIMAKIKVDDRNLTLNAGDRFMQGVFVNYLTTDDDDASGERTGGFGSTGVQ